MAVYRVDLLIDDPQPVLKWIRTEVPNLINGERLIRPLSTVGIYSIDTMRVEDLARGEMISRRPTTPDVGTAARSTDKARLVLVEA